MCAAQATSAASLSTYAVLSAGVGATDYLTAKGNGLLSVSGDLVLGDAGADTVTLAATIRGATPLVFEGGYVTKLPTTLTTECAMVCLSGTSFFCVSGAGVCLRLKQHC